MKCNESANVVKKADNDASSTDLLTGQKQTQEKTTTAKVSDCNPMEMCKQMMESITTVASMAGLATPEVRALFEEWSAEVEKEVLAVIGNTRQAEPLVIAQQLKISENTALYFISKLIRDKKIKATGLEPV